MMDVRMILQNGVLSILVLMIIPVNALAQSTPTPVSLSDRVGLAIDPDEQAYFNLFHRYSNFKQASFQAIGDSLRLLELTTERNGQEVVQRDTLELAVFDELARYVSRYEVLFDDTRNVEWGLIIPYAGPRGWKHKRGKAFVKLLDGQHHEGRIVYVDDNLMMLTPSEETLPYLFATQLTIIDPATIETLRFRFGPVQAVFNQGDDFLFFSKTRYIFGNQTRYEKQIASSLQRQAIITDIHPPELDSAKTIAPVALLRPPSPAEDQFLKRLDRRWAFKVNTTLPLMRSDGSFKFTSTNPVTGDRRLELTDLTFQAFLQRKISDRFYVGGAFQYYPDSRIRPINYFDPTGFPLPLDVREQSHIQLSGFSVIPTVSYLIKTSDKKRYALEREVAFGSRFEVMLSVGPSFSTFTHSASVDPRDIAFLYTGYLVQVHSFSWDDFAIGGLGQLDIHFYPREFFSIGLTGEYTAIRFKGRDLATLDNPLQEGLNYDTMSLVASSTFLTQASLYLSLRLHL